LFARIICRADGALWGAVMASASGSGEGVSDAAREKQDKWWPRSNWSGPAHPDGHWAARRDRGLEGGSDLDPPGGWVLVLMAAMIIGTVAGWGMFLIDWRTS
jgi:hypothetical protein